MHAAHPETTFISVNFLRFIPLLPFLGMLVHVFAGERLGRSGVGLVACGTVALSFAFALRAFLMVLDAPEGGALVDNVYTWIQAGAFTVDAQLMVDALTSVMLLVVTGVGLLIHIYSTGYMSHDPDYARFFAYLNLFMASMLVLVLADNLLLMFVGWEGVGLCSYLLIGFWYTDPDKASAGKKAFVVNRIGDAGFILGMLLLFWAQVSHGDHASLRFADVNAAASHLAPGVVLAAALLLFVGATGKSAQIPLFVWLPDAMAGPTPVSALIHAATMVTAGVYMVARLNGLFIEAPVALNVIAIIGALTAIGAATVGIAQRDIKKVLAYSTVSQLGYMFLALGVGAFGAAIFHVVTHAFFKALLFLGAGSVIHAMDDEQDIHKMGGLRVHMPVTFATFFVATLAIAGVPGLSGFFSKDEILAATFDSGHYALWAVAALGAGITAFYMTRCLVLTFFGDFRGGDEHHPHESPSVMTIPLMALGVLAAVGGYMGVPHVLGGHNGFGTFLAPVVGHHEMHIGHGTELALMAVSVGIALGGIALGWKMYASGPEADQRLADRLRGAYQAWSGAYFIDEIYDSAVVANCKRMAGFLWRSIDVRVIDGVANGVASLASRTGDGWRRWSTGNVQHYALTLLLGVMLVLVALVTGVGG